MKQTGVYKITNIVNSKFYIGSSSHDINNRINVHKRLLKQNKHENSYLQASYNKYNLENFKFEIIELCNKKVCIKREQYYLDLYTPYKRSIGYNINEKAEYISTSLPSLGNKIKNNRGGKRTVDKPFSENGERK